MKEKKAAFSIVVLTLILSLALHWNKFNMDLRGSHIWRQTQTQWNIINFHQNDANVLNPRVAHFNNNRDNIYRYEFPLMQWGIGMIHRAFGDSILITRISIFMIGIAALISFYLLVLALSRAHIVAGLSVWALNFSPVFYYWTINPLPDNFALCMGIWYLWAFVKSIQNDAAKYTLLSALFLCLAALSKLPFIVFGAATACYFLIRIQRPETRQGLFKFVLIYLLLLLPVFAWYAWVIPDWGTNPVVRGVLGGNLTWPEVQEILDHHAKRSFPRQLLTPVVQFLFFPAFLLPFFRRKPIRTEVICLLASLLGVIVYFIFEFSAIGKAHDYYLMPFLPFLYLAVAYTIHTAWKVGWGAQVLVIAVLVVMPFQCFDLTEKRWNEPAFGVSSDIYTYKNALRAAVPDGQKCIMLNDNSNFILPYMVNKMGYVFRDDRLPAAWIKNLAEDHDVKYMYSDSRTVDQREDVQALIDSIILVAGDIHVYKLK